MAIENNRLATARRPVVKKTFCTTREAAQILGVSLRTVQLWAESGIVEAWKTSGGHRRVLRQSIDQLLDKPPYPAAAIDNQPVLADRSPDNTKTEPFKILVVEDDQTLLRLYQVKMGRWHMKPQVILASDGYEALILLGQVKPDLLIADLQMPGMDGFRMLQTIRSIPELENLTIVVVTGLDREEVDRRGGVPEGISVLAKPVPFDSLREIAESAAAASHAPREVAR